VSAASGKRLGKVLVQSGVITQEQLDDAIAQQDERSLPATLADLGYADDIKIAQAVANQMGLPFVDLAAYDIDPNAAMAVSAELARRYSVLPIKVQDEELIVAMADPANIFAIDDLRIVTGYDIRPVVAAESDLAATIEKFAAQQTDVAGMVGDLEDSMSTEGEEEEEEGAEGSESATAKLMNVIVTEAIKAGAFGYLTKNVSPETIIDVLRGVRDGNAPLSPEMTAKILGFFRESPRSSPANSLTNREMEILSLLSEGARDKDIAQKLEISVHTVKKHVQNILRKLHVKNRTEAAATMRNRRP